LKNAPIKREIKEIRKKGLSRQDRLPTPGVGRGLKEAQIVLRMDTWIISAGYEKLWIILRSKGKRSPRRAFLPSLHKEDVRSGRGCRNDVLPPVEPKDWVLREETPQSRLRQGWADTKKEAHRRAKNPEKVGVNVVKGIY